MIKPEQIPDEVVEAAAITLMGRLMVSQQDALHVWSGMYEPEKEQFRREARASIAAALNAWPALKICYFLPQGRTIMLPFPNVSKYPRKEVTSDPS